MVVGLEFAGPEAPLNSKRWRNLDRARGLALVLMIGSHTMRTLVDRQEMTTALQAPSWTWLAMLISKAATPLFLLCFGLSLGLRSPSATALLGRAALVWVCYKALLALEVVLAGGSLQQLGQALGGQMLSRHGEILRFYALFLLLAPLLLKLWPRLSPRARVLLTVLPWLLAQVLGSVVWPPKATAWVWTWLGSAGINTFPVLPWMPLVLLGLLLRSPPPRRVSLGLACLAFASFLGLVSDDPSEALQSIVTQRWKRPPQLAYLCFSTALALVALGVVSPAHPIGPQAAGLHPLEVLGRRPLLVFNVHFPLLFALQRLRPEPLEIDRCWGLSLLMVLACVAVNLALDSLRLPPRRPHRWVVWMAICSLAYSCWQAVHLRSYRIHLEGSILPPLVGRVPLSLWFPQVGWQLRWDGSLWSRLPNGGWMRLTQQCSFQVGTPFQAEVSLRLPQQPERVRAYLSTQDLEAEPCETKLQAEGAVYRARIDLQLRPRRPQNDSAPPFPAEWE